MLQINALLLLESYQLTVENLDFRAKQSWMEGKNKQI